MNKRKLLASLALASCMALTVCGVSACGNGGNDDAGSGYSMDISKQVTEWKTTTRQGNTYTYAENVVYCENPTVKIKQCLNIYFSPDYMNGDGSLNKTATVNGYTCETAPILYINSVGAYAGKVPYRITDSSETLAMRQKWYYNYVNQGYVLVFAGARGKDDIKDDKSDGKAPVGLADLKAGIRFLKANGDKMPGDTDKIISNGMSAGGAMSILLAVSGNSREFDTYLQDMGAVTDESDDVYAAQVYCPITDLENADMYYEWAFKNDATSKSTEMSDFQKALSADLYGEFVDYFNSKSLSVSGTEYRLNDDGRSGTFYDWLLEQYETSYEKYALKNNITTGVNGVVSFSNGEAAVSSFDDIINNHNSRSKVCPSFDALDLSSSENNVFGAMGVMQNAADYKRHFSTKVTEGIKALETQFPTEYARYYSAYKTDSDSESVKKMTSLYNPYTYLNDNTTDIASKIRICVGTKDSDTSPAVSATLALKLMSLGINTEYNLIWGLGHTDADYAGDLEAWIDGISK